GTERLEAEARALARLVVARVVDPHAAETCSASAGDEGALTRALREGLVNPRLARFALEAERATGSSDVPPPLASVRHLGPGARIGHYELIRELGRGGMGVVFEGRDLKLPRSVAIKLVTGYLPGSTAEKRFLREVEVVAGLHHPGIVSVHEVGRVGPVP